MRLKLKFGNDELQYAWFQEISNFHGLIIYKNKKWEFVVYDEDSEKKCDFVCHFSRVRNFDPNWHATTYYNLDKELYDAIVCECGKDKHGWAGHPTWCPKWAKP
jgi:hypothetical protein